MSSGRRSASRGRRTSPDNIANIRNRSSRPRLYLLNLRNGVCIMQRVRGCFSLPASGYFSHLRVLAWTEDITRDFVRRAVLASGYTNSALSEEILRYRRIPQNLLISTMTTDLGHNGREGFSVIMSSRSSETVQNVLWQLSCAKMPLKLKHWGFYMVVFVIYQC